MAYLGALLVSRQSQWEVTCSQRAENLSVSCWPSAVSTLQAHLRFLIAAVNAGLLFRVLLVEVRKNSKGDKNKS